MIKHQLNQFVTAVIKALKQGWKHVEIFSISAAFFRVDFHVTVFQWSKVNHASNINADIVENHKLINQKLITKKEIISQVLKLVPNGGHRSVLGLPFYNSVSAVDTQFWISELRSSQKAETLFVPLTIIIIIQSEKASWLWFVLELCSLWVNHAGNWCACS